MKALIAPILLTGVGAIVLLASTICGQPGNAGLLVGNVGPTTIAISIRGELWTQAVDNNCKASRRAGSGLAMAVLGGGTAYDAARKAVWVSDGRAIALQQISNGAVSCQFNATLSGTGKNFFVSGLAHSNRRKQLIQMEMVIGKTSNNLVLRFYDTKSCPPKLLKTTCSFAVPNGNIPGVAHGLAYDEVRDTIFFTTSASGFAGVTSVVNYIPFVVVCLGPVKPKTFSVPLFSLCGGTNTAVQGMAYNSCTQVLYLATRREMMKLNISNLNKPVLVGKTCCKFNQTRKGWAGLAIVPNSVLKSVGTSCLNSGCPSCKSMAFNLVGGDVALGNQDLAIQVTGAPAGGTAAFYLSVDKCVSPGVAIPGICGAVHTPFTAGMPIFIGAFPLGSGSGCTGGLKIPIAVPTSLSLCNVPLCSQFLVRCPTGGVGLTNAIELMIGG